MAKADINDEQSSVNDNKIAGFVEKYRNAIEKNDLITMKLFNRDFMDYYQSMRKIFGLMSLEKLDILSQEEEQSKEEISFKLRQ